MLQKLERNTTNETQNTIHAAAISDTSILPF